MFAVIKTGGKQYRAKPGDVLEIEKLVVEKGNSVTFEEVLLIEDQDKVLIGTPFIENAAVTAVVLDNFKGDKVLVFKKKRRKQYKRTQGHRQELTRVKIEDILTDHKPAAKKAVAVKPEAAQEKTAAKAQAEKPAVVSEPAAAPKKAALKPKAEAKPKTPAKPKPATKPAAEKTAAKTEPQAAAKPPKKAAPKPKAETKPKPKAETKPKPKAETKPKAPAKPKTATKSAAKPAKKASEVKE